MICPRCTKQTEGIHTCTPTKGWRRLEKQRDELLAALEQFTTWGRMQHKAQSKGCHATFDMMALRDEIELAEATIASVKEKKNDRPRRT